MSIHVILLINIVLLSTSPKVLELVVGGSNYH